MQTNFTVSAYNGQTGSFDTENGIGNRLELDEEEILKNRKKFSLEMACHRQRPKGWKL